VVGYGVGVGVYIVRRLLGLLPLLLGMSVILFLLLHLAPGGPTDIYADNPTVRPEDLAAIKRNLGLTDPLPTQYVKWLRRMVVGDWGRSYKDGQPVTATILGRLPATLELMFTATLIAIVLAIPIGIFTATRVHSPVRYVLNVFTMLGISVPTFWSGLLVILLFSVKLGWLPAGGVGGDQFNLGDRIHHLVGPAMVLAAVNVAGWARYVHSSMIEAMQAEYVRTARAKGLSERIVVLRHAFRNASIPVITLLGLQIPGLFSGALVTEVIFSWPGVGRLITESLIGRDYPVLMGTFMLIALLVIVGNLLADVLYGVANPQIRY